MTSSTKENMFIYVDVTAVTASQSDLWRGGDIGQRVPVTEQLGDKPQKSLKMLTLNGIVRNMNQSRYLALMFLGLILLWTLVSPSPPVWTRHRKMRRPGHSS